VPPPKPDNRPQAPWVRSTAVHAGSQVPKGATDHYVDLRPSQSGKREPKPHGMALCNALPGAGAVWATAVKPRALCRSCEQAFVVRQDNWRNAQGR
jgi:hypothetical protein